MAKWWKYFLNPLQPVIDIANKVNEKTGAGSSVNPDGTERDSNVVDVPSIIEKISGLWDDITGKSQIEMQNEANRQMAEEEYQRNLQAIGDTAAAYDAAGLNRNLMYGSGSASRAQYSAPDLQAYSGSAKLDTILNRVGFVTKFIPALYQATAGLEAIDQAREKTKQSEIRTMAMGLNLIDKGYDVGVKHLSLPFVPTISKYKRGYDDYNYFDSLKVFPYSNDPNSLSRYADAALKNTFDKLYAIGLNNQLNSTRNSYLGYQYDLDRRFGSAGRIMGLIGSGVGTAVKAFTGLGQSTKLLREAKILKSHY